MVKVTNNLVGKKLPIAEIFDCGDSTCILEDGRIAFCAWMDVSLFNKLNEEDSILCFTVDDDGKTSIEYIRAKTLATPCEIEITVD